MFCLVCKLCVGCEGGCMAYVPWCHVWVRVEMIVDGEGCCVGVWYSLR